MHIYIYIYILTCTGECNKSESTNRKLWASNIAGTRGPAGLQEQEITSPLLVCGGKWLQRLLFQLLSQRPQPQCQSPSLYFKPHCLFVPPYHGKIMPPSLSLYVRVCVCVYIFTLHIFPFLFISPNSFNVTSCQWCLRNRLKKVKWNKYKKKTNHVAI